MKFERCDHLVFSTSWFTSGLADVKVACAVFADETGTQTMETEGRHCPTTVTRA